MDYTRAVNQNIYRREWQWQEGEYTVTRTTNWSAPGCHDGCGVLYYTKNGRLEKVEGDPNNPYNGGALCMRCLDMCEAIYHKDRLLYPMVRAGERGENKWRRVSWQEAYDLWDSKAKYYSEEFGPESIIGMHGTGRNACQQAPLVTNAGCESPNHTGGFLSGDSCYAPRTTMEANQFGDMVIADMSQMSEQRWDDPRYVVPQCITVWGCEPIHSNSDGFLGHWIVENMKRGSELIVVDPKVTWLAARAKYWLPIRPGTDAALAMAWIKLIVEEDLYDHEFVENWTNGFDEMYEACKDMTLEKAEEITWIPAETIAAAARFYANSHPAAIQWGLKIDQQISASLASVAIADLWTICGNLDVPGGNIIVRGAYDVSFTTDTGIESVPLENVKKRIGVKEFPFRYAIGSGESDDVDQTVEEVEEGGYSIGMAHTDVVLEQVETGKPYPIKMCWQCATNPVANMASEAPRVMEAMKKIEFNVIADCFITPTAVACGDLLLPIAMSAERSSFRVWWSPLRAITPCMEPLGEAKTDEEIIIEIVNIMKPQNAPAETAIEWIETFLPEGLSYDALKEMVYAWPEFYYKKYETGMLRPDGQPGFATWNGKADLVIRNMKHFGLNGAPHFDEPHESPVSTPELAEEYPLILMTGARSFEFFHSEHRQLETMREFHPEPLMQIHPSTAKALGIQDGDWCWIENQRGRCRQVAWLYEGISPKMVHAEHGWWKPEADGAEMFDCFDYNINNLTTQCDVGESGFGAPYNGLLCKVYKCTPENSEISPTEQILRRGGFKYERKHLNK